MGEEDRQVAPEPAASPPLRLLAAVLDRFPEGVIVMDERRRVLYQNALAARQMGLAVGETVPYCSYCRHRPVLPGEERCILMYDDALPVFEAHMPVYEGREGYFQMTVEKFTLDGEKRFTLVLREPELILRREELRVRELLVQETMRAEVEERRRLARELHDEIGQRVYSVFLLLQSIVPAVESGPLRERLERLSRAAEEALQRVRRLAKEIRPAFFDHLTLSAALEQAVREWREVYDIALHLNVESLRCDDVDKEVGYSLYRVMQEAIVNAVRHGKARNVTLELRCEAEGIAFRIEDDGQGFLWEAVTPGLGLYHMKERLERLGGSIRWFSRPGGPTRVEGWVPRQLAQTAHKARDNPDER